MKKNTIRNAAVVMAVLGAMGLAGTMAANAGTTPTATNAVVPANTPTTTAGQDRPGSSSQGEEQAAAASANAAAAPVTSCVAVKVKKTGKSNAKLCATVKRSGLRVNEVQVVLTTPAKACSGKVVLGATTDRGAALTRTTPCTGGNRSATTLTVNRTVADNSQVCGTLAANSRFAAARACIRVTR